MQSAAIDRVIYDRSIAPPLVYDTNHSILPIEIVGGLVEITMNLDARKLALDIEHMAPVRPMRARRYKPLHGNSLAFAPEVETFGPRCFVIGLPADSAWRPDTIARSFLQTQRDVGPQTHIHALYVIGIGVFQTIGLHNPDGTTSRKVNAWLGQERLARFAEILRQAMDGWIMLPHGMSADLKVYAPGEPTVFRQEHFTE